MHCWVCKNITSFFRMLRCLYYKFGRWNIFVLHGNVPPKGVSIVGCTSYMSNGGKKDETYIIEQFQKKLMENEIDQDRKLSDCFFFDGASSIQNAGQILCAIYHRARCFHGGGHVLSFLLSKLSILKPMHVSTIVFIVHFMLLFYYPLTFYPFKLVTS